MGSGAIVSIEDLKFLTADVRGWTLVCAGVRWCAIEHFALNYQEQAERPVPQTVNFLFVGSRGWAPEPART